MSKYFIHCVNEKDFVHWVQIKVVCAVLGFLRHYDFYIPHPKHNCAVVNHNYNLRYNASTGR